MYLLCRTPLEHGHTFRRPGPFDLKARFRLQYTLEENGDVSTRLHKGDVGTAAGRYEFIKLTEDKTLVVFTSWQDLDTAGFFRKLLEAQPLIKPTIPAIFASMSLQQVKDSFDPSVDEQGNKDIADLAEAKIPALRNNRLPVPLLDKLNTGGTAMILHPRMRKDHKDKPYSLLYVSTFSILPAHVDKVVPLSSDYSRLPEYFPWATNVSKTKNKKGELVDLDLEVKIPLITLDMFSQLQMEWVDDRALEIEATKGSFEPMLGGLEYMPIKGGDETLIIYTIGLKIGDDASLLLKVMRNMPLVDLIMSLAQGMLIVEKQNEWIEDKL